MCTCTEDKEVIGNVIIGRNKVTCQECLDNNARMEVERIKQADRARLDAIDKEAGCGRTVREILIGEGKKGFANKLETLEAEAAIIRGRL